MKDLITMFILALIAGYQIGVLRERWIYFKKTGKHLKYVKKNHTNANRHKI